MTADVLEHTDAATGKPFVDVVDDAAEQKGTGRWTVQSALDLGVPITGIAEATFARSLSGHTEQREGGPEGLLDRPRSRRPSRSTATGSSTTSGPRCTPPRWWPTRRASTRSRPAPRRNGWDIDLGMMATIWRGGCIIRAQFLDRIKEAYADEPDLTTLLTTPYFVDAVTDGVDAWRRVVATAAQAGVPTPAFSSSLAYFDGLRRERLPAALIQALRDNFGAHTYRRIDRPGTFHTTWAGDHTEQEMP